MMVMIPRFCGSGDDGGDDGGGGDGSNGGDRIRMRGWDGRGRYEVSVALDIHGIMRIFDPFVLTSYEAKGQTHARAIVRCGFGDGGHNDDVDLPATVAGEGGRETGGAIEDERG